MLEIQKNIKLSDYSTFKIGGPAEFFVEVENEEELLEAINYAKENNLKFFVLGGGSNILFADEGFDGIIIKISAQGGPASGWQNTSLKIWAGYSLSSLVNFAKENGLSGMEWASGIPGTIGGAIRGNAGAFGGDMSNAILEVKVLDTEEVQSSKLKVFSNKECGFDYRNSIFKQNDNLVIVSAKIKLEKGNKEEIESKMKEILTKRAEKQPKGWIGSSGSFFKNPIVENGELIEKFEKDTGNKSMDGKIPAGWLIDEVGLRGKKIGNVMVSEENANFIINNDNGTAEEIVMLASIIKQKVRNEFGVQLKEEVKIVYY